MWYNKKVNYLLILVQKVFLKKRIVENSQFICKLRIPLANMRTWQIHNELSNKLKLKNFLINIHIQLNCLIEVQYNILNMMRQRINFSSVLIKQLNSTSLRTSQKLILMMRRTFSWLSRFNEISAENNIID